MRILLISHYFYPHIGGIEGVVYNQAKTLMQKGHTVTVVTSRIAHEKKYEIIDGIVILRVKALNVLEKSLHVPYPIFSLSLIPVVFTEIKKHDIVHIHGALYGGSFFASFFAKLFHKPVIMTEHVGFVPYASAILNAVQRVAFFTIGAITCNLSAHIFVLNKITQHFIRRFTQTPVTLLPNGVDTHLFHPVSASEKQQLRKKYNLPLGRMLVLYIGRFVQKKNVHLVLEAKNDSFDLVLAGNGQLPDIQNKKGIHNLGSLSQENIAELYQACDIFVLPSTGEGFPLSIQEAMSSGLPVITASLGVDSTRYSDAILHIRPTAKDLASAIQYMVKNPTIGKTMGEKGRNIALKEFSWDLHVQSLLTIYEAFVQKTYPKRLWFHNKPKRKNLLNSTVA